MRIITQDEVNEVMRLHGLWLANEAGGKRANLQGADLRGANLRWANLRGAIVEGANFQGAIVDDVM